MIKFGILIESLHSVVKTRIPCSSRRFLQNWSRLSSSWSRWSRKSPVRRPRSSVSSRKSGNWSWSWHGPAPTTEQAAVCRRTYRLKELDSLLLTRRSVLLWVGLKTSSFDESGWLLRRNMKKNWSTKGQFSANKTKKFSVAVFPFLSVSYSRTDSAWIILFHLNFWMNEKFEGTFCIFITQKLFWPSEH